MSQITETVEMKEEIPTIARLSAQTETPEWVGKLVKRPLVEMRRGISLGYEPPVEDMSVIALTTPSGKFVDLRLLNSEHSKHFAAEKGSTKIPGFCTAGTCVTTVQEGTATCPGYECMVQAKWHHPIDSSESFETDGADLYLLGNGDIMEIGIMMINGKLEMFKEYWIQPEGTAGRQPYVVVETGSAEMVATSGNGIGMVIRIGNYCQGVFQDKDNFWLERWEKGVDGKWAKDYRSNTDGSTMALPCAWAVTGTKSLGENVVTDGRVWKVTEVSKND